MKNLKLYSTVMLAFVAVCSLQAAVTSSLRIDLSGNANSNKDYVMIRVADAADVYTDFTDLVDANYDIDVYANATYYYDYRDTEAKLANTVLAVNPAVGSTTYTLTFKLGNTNTETFTFFDAEEMTTPITVTNGYSYTVTLGTATTSRTWINDRFYINYIPNPAICHRYGKLQITDCKGMTVKVLNMDGSATSIADTNITSLYQEIDLAGLAAGQYKVEWNSQTLIIDVQ